MSRCSKRPIEQRLDNVKVGETTMTQPDPGVLRPVARPTMRDVAALAGVSFKTVSRVINGVSTVDPELAARVNTAADRLGYRPYFTATNLGRREGTNAGSWTV